MECKYKDSESWLVINNYRLERIDFAQVFLDLSLRSLIVRILLHLTFSYGYKVGKQYCIDFPSTYSCHVYSNIEIHVIRDDCLWYPVHLAHISLLLLVQTFYAPKASARQRPLLRQRRPSWRRPLTGNSNNHNHNRNNRQLMGSEKLAFSKSCWYV